MSPEQPSPKVFISHASEDKARFVEDFARKLLDNGVDAWLDQWEISPGDDLPQRIFEEGIKSADAVIVVLSPDFVRKPWLRHELSATLIGRIHGDIKIIPVVIENCDVPQSLQSTLWVRISDLSSYDAELRRIVMAIFDLSNKPPLGRPPTFASLSIDNFPGLSKLDTTILIHACELSLSTGSNLIQSSLLEKLVQELGVPREDVTDSLEILEDRRLIKPSRNLGRTLPSFSITTHGFENYARFRRPGFSAVVNDALLAIVNHGIKTAGSLAKHLGQDAMLIEYVLDILSDRRLIEIGRYGGSDEGAVIEQIGPLGRRRAVELSNR